MKNKFVQKRRVVKGTSRAIVLSVIIHAGLFLLAGLLVVFTVVNKPEPVFEKVETIKRPRMKLKKPKIRQKTKSKPTPPDRISSSRGQAALPEMEVPALSSMEETLEFDLTVMEDVTFDTSVTELGAKGSIGSDLEGTFYDMKFTRSGTFAPLRDGYRRVVGEFWRSGCDPATLKRYYRSPNKLYATYICFPKQPSA